MGVQLPNGGNVFVPQVPSEIREDTPELYEFLASMRQAVDAINRNAFSNAFTITTAMNVGISGTFVVSSGSTIIVTSGIVTSIV